jgi:hypothetical protein
MRDPKRRVGLVVDRNISLLDFYVLLSTKLNIPLKSIALFYFHDFYRWPRLLVQNLDAINKKTNKLAALYKKKGYIEECVLYVHDLRMHTTAPTYLQHRPHSIYTDENNKPESQNNFDFRDVSKDLQEERESLSLSDLTIEQHYILFIKNFVQNDLVLADIRHFCLPVTVGKIAELFPNKVLALEHPEKLSEAIDTSSEEARQELLTVHYLNIKTEIGVLCLFDSKEEYELARTQLWNTSQLVLLRLNSRNPDQGVSVTFNQQSSIRDLFEYISNELFQKEIPVQNIMLKYSSSPTEISNLFPEEARLQDKIESIVHL